MPVALATLLFIASFASGAHSLGVGLDLSGCRCRLSWRPSLERRVRKQRFKLNLKPTEK
ncbi:hypothetical protein [Bradyrhizobium liaoningense]